MKPLFQLRHDVFAADAVGAIIVEEETTLAVILRGSPSSGDWVRYEFDTEEEARRAQLEAVSAWRKALAGESA